MKTWHSNTEWRWFIVLVSWSVSCCIRLLTSESTTVSLESWSIFFSFVAFCNLVWSTKRDQLKYKNKKLSKQVSSLKCIFIKWRKLGVQHITNKLVALLGCFWIKDLGQEWRSSKPLDPVLYFRSFSLPKYRIKEIPWANCASNQVSHVKHGILSSLI